MKTEVLPSEKSGFIAFGSSNKGANAETKSSNCLLDDDDRAQLIGVSS